MTSVLAQPETAAENVRNALQMLLDVNANHLPTSEGTNLMAARARLKTAIAQLEAHRCSLPASVVEALNSGDGTYRQ